MFKERKIIPLVDDEKLDEALYTYGTFKKGDNEY